MRIQHQFIPCTWDRVMSLFFYFFVSFVLNPQRKKTGFSFTVCVQDHPSMNLKPCIYKMENLKDKLEWEWVTP